jgi:hypothetical protein
MPKEFEIPPSFCLKCGHSFNRASTLTGTRRPEPGHLTLCMKCGTLLRFTPAMTVMPVSDEEAAIRDLPPATAKVIRTAQDLIRNVIGPLMKPETKH